MENAVKAICQALIEEAGLVISHTDKIAALGSSDARTTAQAIDGMAWMQWNISRILHWSLQG